MDRADRDVEGLQEKGLSLIDAMSASVAAVERGTLPPPAASRLPPSGFDMGISSLAVEAFITTQAAEAPTGGDVFGIDYKPYGKASRPSGYALPAASSSRADYEDEAMNSLAARQQVAAANSAKEEDDDDDFDFSDDSSGGTTDAVMDAVRRASERATQEKEAAAMISGLQSEAHAAMALSLALEESPFGQIVEKRGQRDATLGIRKAAEEAMSAITQAYGSGTGDFHSAEPQISSLVDSESVSLGFPLAAASVSGGGTIEEGDEEAAERQEEEEERVKLALAQESLRVKALLEAEWQGFHAHENDAVHPAAAQLSLSTLAPSVSGSESGEISTRVGYKKVMAYLQELDLSRYEATITTTAAAGNPQQSRSWSSSFFSLVGAGSSPAKLQLPDADKQLAWPFLVAQVDYDPSVPTHLALLRTIFDILVPSTPGPPESLSGGKKHQSVPVTGPHWDKIGFQGLDPRTDINRSMKMFALVQALHLVTQRTSEAQRLHDLSTRTASVLTNGQDLSWPFMCVSILFTKEAIQALRSGSLNRLCNEIKDVVSVLHDFHHACFHEFGRRLSDCPSVHHAVHLAAIRKLCESGGGLALFKAYREKSRKDSEGTAKLTKEDLVEFASIDEMADGMEKKGFGFMEGTKAAKFVV